MLTEGVVVDRKLGGPLGLISPNDAVVELGKEARLGSRLGGAPVH